MLILADENVNFKIIKQLRKNGIEVISILEQYPSISDKKVLEYSIYYKAILLTEDSDFGEWISAHGQKSNGVIFLRYKSHDFIDITNSLLKIISTANNLLYGKFVVITVKKIRIRDI